MENTTLIDHRCLTRHIDLEAKSSPQGLGAELE